LPFPLSLGPLSQAQGSDQIAYAYGVGDIQARPKSDILGQV
jgi:hypothetical protein